MRLSTTTASHHSRFPGGREGSKVGRELQDMSSFWLGPYLTGLRIPHTGRDMTGTSSITAC